MCFEMDLLIVLMLLPCTILYASQDVCMLHAISRSTHLDHNTRAFGCNINMLGMGREACKYQNGGLGNS